MKKKQFIIVGQGLAGSMLAYFLIKKGHDVMVYDEGHGTAASSVAAGLINPITGRRLVKSDNIDVLLPFAEKTYMEIESFLGIKLWYPREIYWTLSDIKEENDWAIRASLPEVKHYIQEDFDKKKYKNFFNEKINFGVVKNAAQVDLVLFIAAFRFFLKEKNMLTEKRYDFINSHQQETVIYCEGAQARFNPLWSWLPFNVVKGEALHLKLESENLKNVIKNNVNIIPQEGQNCYWLGSNYEWNPTDSSPTPSIKEGFLNELNQFLNIDYQVIAHKSAIRPATKDRKLFIGFHPENPFCAIFNGLGAKGTSLAPFWANHFANVLIDTEKLSDVMSIQRFD